MDESTIFRVPYKKNYTEVKLDINPSNDNQYLPLWCHSNECYYPVTTQTKIPDDVKDRYKFSSYIVDPNKYGWKRSIRIIAIIKRFIKCCLDKTNIDLPSSSEQ